MTQTIIQLYKGDNWLSFPESSMNTLMQILTNSGIYSNIVAVHIYDPIFSKFDQIDLNISFIEKGKGYHITMLDVGSIIYEGIPYATKMTFDVLRSSLMRGWNLIGTSDEDIIIPPEWCRVIDANTNFQTARIEPMKAYWILYPDECSPVSSWTLPIVISVTSLAIFAYVAFGPEIKGFMRKRKQINVRKLEKEKSLDRIGALI